MRITKLFGTLVTFGLLFTLAANGANAAEITGTRKATVRWNGVVGAEGYNIYYKEKYENQFVHSVRDLSKDSREYTIGYLKNKGTYVYKLCAIKGDKSEFWCSETRVLGKGTVVATATTNGKTNNTVTKNVISGYKQATVSWLPNDKAEHYYIFYKKTGEENWTHSVIGLNHESVSYTINYLDNSRYQYQLVALDGNYKPIAWSEIGTLHQR